MYCIRCHAMTGTKSPHQKHDKNGRLREAGTCTSCGSMKSKPAKSSGPVMRRSKTKKQQGGFLEELSEAIPALQQVVGSLIPLDQSTMDYFNKLLGSGMSQKKSKAWKQGVIMHHLTKQKGGDLASGWHDFTQGFSWGFQHPIDAIKAIGKAIGLGVKGGDEDVDGEGMKKRKPRRKHLKGGVVDGVRFGARRTGALALDEPQEVYQDIEQPITMGSGLVFY